MSVAVSLGDASESTLGDLEHVTEPPEGEVCYDGADGDPFCPAVESSGSSSAAGDMNGDGVQNINDVILLVKEIFDHNEEVMNGGGDAA